MILAGWYDNPAVVGLIVGAPMAILAYLGWWRTRGLDETAKQVALEAKRTSHNTQVIEEFESIIKAMQGELRRLYQLVEALRKENEKLEGRIAELENGRA